MPHRRVLHLLAELAFPTRCLGCNARGDDWFCPSCAQASEHTARAGTCLRCRRVTPKLGTLCRTHHQTLNLDGFATYADYHARPVSRALHWLKYRGAFGGTQAFVRLAFPRWKALLNSLPDTATIIPVPSTPRHERVRGFSLPLLIARALAAHTHHPLLPQLRRRDAPAQVGLNRADREANVRDVFSWSHPRLAEPVILVDDVITTGATLREAASTLRMHGAPRVVAITLAEESAD